MREDKPSRCDTELSEGNMPPLLLTVAQTCKVLNCARSTVFVLLSDGQLERVKIGRATRVTLASIHDFVEAR